jgi:hypothetical protein
MKIKKIQLSLIVLFALVIASFSFFATAQEQATTTKNIFLDNDQDGLSDAEETTYGTDPQKADSDGDGYSDGAEVQSGYDPTKPSPGDKIIPTIANATTETPVDSAQENLTINVTQKIATMLSSSDPANKDVTLEQVNSLVDDSLNTQVSSDEMPVVTKDDIIIKQDDFKGLNDEQITAAKKDDLTDYIVGVSYVLSSNSPTPVTSTSDISTLSNSITQSFTTAITSQDPKAIADILATDQKIIEQMKSIPVPEDLADLHIEALQITEYAQNLNTLFAPNPTDPLTSIANFSKVLGFMSYASAFSDDMTAKIDSYDLTFDDSLQNKLSSYGMDLPSDDLVQKLSQ